MRHLPRALVALAVALAAHAGCAAMQSSAPSAAPGAPLEPHAEIAQLEARIAAERPVLGLGLGEGGAPVEPQPGVRAAEPSAVVARSPRCAAVDDAAGEICRAADRICVLSRQLDEEPARRSCTAAGDDCQRARAAAAACR